MPTAAVTAVINRIKALEDSLKDHLIESGAIKSDLTWLKWINTGIAGLVLLKLVVDWIK